MNLIPEKTSTKRVFKIPLELHPKQLEIERSTARFKIIRAGRKFGKTVYAQKKALDWLGKPNAVHWHIAPTYTQAKLISWDEFKKIIPPEALGKKPNDTELTMTLKNGSRLHLMGSDNLDSLRGPAPTSFTFEEMAFHKPEAWYQIMRPNIMPHKSPGIFIGTPKGFNWVHDLETEALKRISEGNKDWAVYHFSVYDNPYISKDEVEEARRDCDNEQVWRQEYLAEYESSVGRVFGQLDGKIGGRHFRQIPVSRGTFDCYRSIDWGMRDNTAALWGFIRGHVLYVYREYLANNLSAPAQAGVIKNQTPRNENVLRNALSHDAAKEDPAMKGLTVLWHFRQAGLGSVIPSSRNKSHSRAMINELIRQNRMVIDPYSCPKLKKQLLAYEWKDTTMEKPDDSQDDDAVDSLHYLVEMLQFDLFLDKKNQASITQDQMLAEIAKERLDSWKNPRTAVPSSAWKDSEFGDAMDNSSAGYL